MTSQSYKENYSENPESHQDDDGLLKDWVPDPDAEEVTIEEIIKALDYEPVPRRAIPPALDSGAAGMVAASPGSSAAPMPTVVAAPRLVTWVPADPEAASVLPATGASSGRDDMLTPAMERSETQDDVNDHGTANGRLQPASIDPLVAAVVNSEIEVDNLAASSRGQFDKLAKRNRPISLLRDAAFVRALEALLAAEASTSGRETSVSSHTCSSLTLSYPSLTNLAASRERPSEQGKSPRDPRAAWWHVLLAKPAHDYRVPATWRDTSDQLRILYRHLALREFGEVHSFTLNLKPDIEERARSQSNPAGWFHDRIVHHLKAVLGRGPEFHFVLEEAEAHRLHVHGEIQCTSAETAAVRKALRLAGGEWDVVRQHQAHTDNDPDQGWASYISKDSGKSGSPEIFCRNTAILGQAMPLRFLGMPFRLHARSVRRRLNSLRSIAKC